jgi:hypothetical protein
MLVAYLLYFVCANLILFLWARNSKRRRMRNRAIKITQRLREADRTAETAKLMLELRRTLIASGFREIA